MNINQIFELMYKYSPNIIIGVIIFILFWFFSKITQFGIKNLLEKINPSNNISNVIASIIKNLIVIIGFITALGSIGVNISAIVAGLGLTGFAFGFAFKDMLSSFISGIMIFIYQPFKLGEIIEVDGKKGEVIDINLRYVTLRGKESKMLIPNSLLVSKSLEVQNR
mgnify:FL=1|tara:strand:- start:129 stop:626 length:498 start_codon:yes stop_codon:yes gene_type:complete